MGCPFSFSSRSPGLGAGSVVTHETSRYSWISMPGPERLDSGSRQRSPASGKVATYQSVTTQ